MVTIIYIYFWCIYIFCRLEGSNYTIIMEDDDKVELSFTRTWDITTSNGSILPMNFDKRCSVILNTSLIVRFIQNSLLKIVKNLEFLVGNGLSNKIFNHFEI